MTASARFVTPCLHVIVLWFSVSDVVELVSVGNWTLLLTLILTLQVRKSVPHLLAVGSNKGRAPDVENERRK